MHASMTDDYGIPVWGSYLIFAVATIILGLFIGLVSMKFCIVYSYQFMFVQVDGSKCVFCHLLFYYIAIVESDTTLNVLLKQK